MLPVAPAHGEKTRVLVTVPTTAYFQNQLIYLGETGRTDFQEVPTHELSNLEKIRQARDLIMDSFDAKQIKPNTNDEDEDRKNKGPILQLKPFGEIYSAPTETSLVLNGSKVRPGFPSFTEIFVLRKH